MLHCPTSLLMPNGEGCAAQLYDQRGLGLHITPRVNLTTCGVIMPHDIS